MRDKIKELARDLLIRDGYSGFRFQDLAEQLGVTRASIHYHFVSKQKLCEEVILESLALSVQRYEEMLVAGSSSFEARVRAIMEMNRARYLQYNPTGKTRHPWALISRIRLEQEQLGPAVRDALADFRKSLEKNLARSLQAAVARGEFDATVPVRDLTVLFIAIINSSDPTTRDTASFKRMEELYLAFLRLAQAGYAAR